MERMNKYFKVDWILPIGLILVALIWVRGFYDLFITPKWITIHLITFLTLISLIINKNLKIPVLDKRILHSFLAVLGFTGLALLINNHDTYLVDGKDWFCFAGLFFATINIGVDLQTFLRRVNYCFQIAAVVVCTTGLIQYLQIDIPKLVYNHPNLFGTFGNKNMAGEFVGLSLIFNILSFLSLKNKKNLYGGLSLFIIVANFVYFYALFARASIVGFGVAFLAILLFKKEWRLKLIVSGTLLTAMFSVFLFTKVDLTNIESSTAIRLVRWINTSIMMFDRPLGIGFDNYGYEYLSYSSSYLPDSEATETHLVRAPHNGFLELGVELGLGTLVAFLVFGFFLFRRMFEKLKIGDIHREKSYYKLIPYSVLCFILTDAFFAFPMELPFPFYIMAITLGLICLQLFPVTEISLREALPIHATVFAGILMAIPFSASKVTWMKRSDYSKAQLSCDLDPSFWLPCMNFSKMQLYGNAKLNPDDFKYDNLYGALDTTVRMLSYNPKNFIAIRRAATIYRDLNRREDACRYFNRYNQLYPGKNMLKEKGFLDFCQDSTP